MSIAWRADPSKIGVCGFQRLAQEGVGYEPGFMLLPGIQGNGVGTEVVDGLCQRLLCQTAATEIWLQYRTDNVAADRLVKRLGFTVEYQANSGRVILRR